MPLSQPQARAVRLAPYAAVSIAGTKLTDVAVSGII